MRIIIDLQGAQTESRYRGIGRYSLSFAKAVARLRGEHDVVIVLNGLFADTIEPLRAAFRGVLAENQIVVWEAPGPVYQRQDNNHWRRESAELLREAFIASLQPDIVHVTSLFEGYIDDAVTSVGSFAKGCPVSVTLYDLIPLLNPSQYLDPNPGYNHYYRNKLAHLQRASLLLAISGHAKSEAESHLAPRDGSIINVSAAIDERFYGTTRSPEVEKAVKDRWGVAGDFLLYSGGADERKNLPRLIQAYARLAPQLRQRYQLVLAGRMPEGEVQRLKEVATANCLKADSIIFTGYLSDDELRDLYLTCELFIFPSWHEGFGLPPLEAMACGAAVVAANTSSLPEVVGIAEALFDPFDTQAIADKISEVLNCPRLLQKLRLHGLEQARGFSWDKCALTAIAAFEKVVNARGLANCKELSPKARPKKPMLAWVVPCEGDVDGGLLDILSAHYDIYLVVDEPGMVAAKMKYGANIRSIAWLKANHANFHRIVYELGNSVRYASVYESLAEVPGLVILHDFYLGKLLKALEESSGGSLFAQALYEAHGYLAIRDYDRADGGEVVDFYPASYGVFRDAIGVILTASEIADLVQYWYGGMASSTYCVIAYEVQKQDANLRAAIAERYRLAIEGFYQRALTQPPNLVATISHLPVMQQSEEDFVKLAQAIAVSLPRPKAARRLLVDVTDILGKGEAAPGALTFPSLIEELLEIPQNRIRVEPVYLAMGGRGWHYRFARIDTLAALGCRERDWLDDVVDPARDDFLFRVGASEAGKSYSGSAELIAFYRRQGVKCCRLSNDAFHLWRGALMNSVALTKNAKTKASIQEALQVSDREDQTVDVPTAVDWPSVNPANALGWKDIVRLESLMDQLVAESQIENLYL